MAQNAMRKLRTVRFPYVLKFLDMAESQGTIYLVVERVTPLVEMLDSWSNGVHDQASSAWVGWGISHIASAIAFLNTQVGAIHGNVQPSSVFLSPAGEWLLGGFEMLTTANDTAFLAQHGDEFLNACKYAAPEVQKGWGNVAQLPIHAVDSFAVGLLALKAFNNQIPANTRSFPAGRVPASLYPLLKQLIHADPNSRLSTSDLITKGNKPGGFLATNEFVRASTLLEEFRLADTTQKEAILAELEHLQPHLAPNFAQFKVVPVLVEAFRSKAAPNGLNDGLTLSARVLLPLILRLGEHLDAACWKHTLATPVLDAFNTPYSPMRAALLAHLNLYVDHLEPRMVTSRVWPALSSWFEDPYEAIRAAVLDSIPLLIPKLSDRVLNNELLRQLAKTQVDPQPALRIQTTTLLGQLIPHLTVATRANVLVPAFSRSLKDNFEHARLAGVEAFRLNQGSFDAEASARCVIPALSPCLVDKNHEVRVASLTTLQAYLDKIQTYTANQSSITTELPSLPTLPGPSEEVVPNESRSAFSFLSATAGSAASKLSDWAIAQLDADELPDTSAKPPGSAVSTPGSSTPPVPAEPVIVSFGSRSATGSTSGGMTLGKKMQADPISNAFQVQPPKPSTAAIRPKFGSAVPTRSEVRPSVPEVSSPSAPLVRPSPPASSAPVRPATQTNPAANDAPPKGPVAHSRSRAPVSTPPSWVPSPGAPTVQPKPPSAAASAKMAQLQRLREERRAVRLNYLLSAKPRPPLKVNSAMYLAFVWPLLP